MATELDLESSSSMTPGGSTLTILETDLGHLGNIDNHYGWCYDVYVTVANGTVELLHSLWVEVRFVV